MPHYRHTKRNSYLLIQLCTFSITRKRQWMGPEIWYSIPEHVLALTCRISHWDNSKVAEEGKGSLVNHRWSIKGIALLGQSQFQAPRHVTHTLDSSHARALSTLVSLQSDPILPWSLHNSSLGQCLCLMSRHNKAKIVKWSSILGILQDFHLQAPHLLP